MTRNVTTQTEVCGHLLYPNTPFVHPKTDKNGDIHRFTTSSDVTSSHSIHELTLNACAPIRSRGPNIGCHIAFRSNRSTHIANYPRIGKQFLMARGRCAQHPAVVNAALSYPCLRSTRA